MRKKMAIAMIVSSAAASAADGIEIPVFEGGEIEYADAMKSSNPNLMMRDVTYHVSASAEEVLSFYKDSHYVKECEENSASGNYVCEIAEHERVTKGTLAISLKQKRGKTEVYANYFFKE